MHTVLGQPEAIDQLSRALVSGRFHHAWIFAGPKGVGKFTCAMELAKILLDPAAGPNLAGEIEADPDGETVRLIEAGMHPDLHVIRKELALYSADPKVRGSKQRNISIHIFRQFVIGGHVAGASFEAAAYRTSQRRHGKVFIVDEAELIDETSQNALLKTLEEPPQRTYLILVTSRPERLLPTVLSRCQRVQFRRLDESTMREWFGRAQLDVKGDEADWVIHFADGSPGLAKLAAEYGFCEWNQRLRPHLDALEDGRFPVELGPLLSELVEGFAREWCRRNPNASKDAANKDGLRHVITLLAAHARTKLNDAAARGDNPEPWPRVIDVLSDAEYHVNASVNLKQALENLVVQWANLAPVAA